MNYDNRNFFQENMLITWSFDLIVSFTFQLILDRYSLLEAELRWFYSSLSLYIKQEIQHGVRRNVLVCSAADVYLLIYSAQAYMLVNGKKYLYFS